MKFASSHGFKNRDLYEYQLISTGNILAEMAHEGRIESGSPQGVWYDRYEVCSKGGPHKP